MAATGLFVQKLREWREHPAQMVRELWGVRPDPWQEEALEAYPHVARLALKACKGPGKTAVLAWIAWNFMLTRRHPMIGATSVNGDNLRANLWTELARWRSGCELLESLFEMTKTEIFSREHRATWKLEARTWAKDADATQIGNALAGVHAKYVMWLGDESGDYPDAIMPVMEGIFAGSPLEAHIIQAGNPLKLAGPLYRACTSAAALWRVIEITGDPDDPKRSSRISIEHAREQIAQYGRDNPWVLVNIFGQFPPSSVNALLGPDDLSRAMGRQYRDSDIGHAARVLGVDVARFGDDASVVFPRQGLIASMPQVWRNVDTFQGAGGVAAKARDWKADAVFIDESGGYGAGWIDAMRQLGHQPIGVQFAGRPNDMRYANKRAEMYFLMADWIKSSGCLPQVPELTQALTQITYSFQRDRLLLEDKAQLKTRIGLSPDHADALALTFAQPVMPKEQRFDVAALQPWQRRPAEYDPFAEYRGRLH